MIEYHDILNPKLWENNQLIPEIKNKLIEIYQTFINKLKENEIPIEVIDVLLLGSNAAYNYTDYSDIDLHIITDFDDIPLNDTLTQLFYNNEKSKFNDDYDIFIKGLPVELYIEDIDAGNKSEGVYSLLQDKWLKFPEYNPPQEVDYSFLLDTYKSKILKAINSNNPENIKKVINEIRMLRKMSLMDDGIYSKGNLVFKELRNDGSIESLYNKLHELVSQELSLENKQLIESEDSKRIDLFEFDWENGSINENIIKQLQKENKIWRYNNYFQLEIKVAGQWHVIKNEINDNHVKVYYEYKENILNELISDMSYNHKRFIITCDVKDENEYNKIKEKILNISLHPTILYEVNDDKHTLQLEIPTTLDYENIIKAIPNVKEAY